MIVRDLVWMLSLIYIQSWGMKLQGPIHWMSAMPMRSTGSLERWVNFICLFFISWKPKKCTGAWGLGSQHACELSSKSSNLSWKIVHNSGIRKCLLGLSNPVPCFVIHHQLCGTCATLYGSIRSALSRGHIPILGSFDPNKPDGMIMFWKCIG